MWGLIISLIALTIVLTATVALYFQHDKIKTDVNQKLNSVVDQINDSQYYEYKFDKLQDENIKNVDDNMTSIYDNVLNLQNNVKFLQNTALTRTDFEKRVQTDNLITNSIKLGDKYTLVSDDSYVKLFDKGGSDYYGGFAAKSLWSKDGANLNGATNITGQLKIDGVSTLKGGKSSKNPEKLDSYFPHIDGKNYIRGDTEISGHVTHNGTLMGDQLKIGHKYSGWPDRSVMTTYANDGQIGASFGGVGGLWSHFPADDQSTYIRPGKDGGDIIIGDSGASKVNIGKDDFKTNINIKGNTNLISVSGRTVLSTTDNNVQINGNLKVINTDNKNILTTDKDSLQINGNLKICDVNGSKCKTYTNV
jgi:hypothetical protein